MKLPRALLAWVLLVVPALAQDYSSIPGGYLSKEADRYSVYFGSRPSMRAQILNSDHRGKVRSFREVSARLDGGRASSQFLGRSWTNVTLTVGEGSYASASPAFARNLSVNTRVVFSQRVVWPSAVASSPRPGLWGAPVYFPFASVWVYTGKQDLVLDFTFNGGALGNNAPWTGYSYYYLDGLLSSTSVGGISINYGTNDCTNAPHTAGPFCVPVFRSYAKDTGNPTTSDKFGFYWWLYRYPVKTPTAFGLSLSGGTNGIDIGSQCNSYYLGSGPLLLMFATTPSSNSGSLLFPNPRLYAQYDANAVGLRLYTQAAWTHPTRKRFELTRAGYTDIARQPVPIQGTKWHWATPASTTSAAINQTYMPLLRLRY